MNKANRILKLVFGLALMTALSACGKIPKAYQGEYLDATTGTKLNLTAEAGTLTSAEGKVMEHKATDLKFDALLKGTPGIYVRAQSEDPNNLEVFWLVPVVDSRKEESGFVWFTAEVLYTKMKIKAKDPVAKIQLLHCTDGMLMLDLPSKAWNGGCPGEAQILDMDRVSTKQ